MVLGTSGPNKCGNPLFCKWLEEWIVQVQATNKNFAYTLKKACDSLKQYPLPIEAKATEKLKGIGPKIAQYLDKRWKEYQLQLGNSTPTTNTPSVVTDTLTTTSPRDTEPILSVYFTQDCTCSPPLPVQEPPPSLPKPLSKNKTSHGETSTKPKTKRRRQEYIPNFRSGGYAILLALRDLHLSANSPLASFSKESVVETAQQYCDIPMDKPLPNCRYTGWSSIISLKKHDLIYSVSRPAKFALSDSGHELCERLVQANNSSDKNCTNSFKQNELVLSPQLFLSSPHHEMEVIDFDNYSTISKRPVTPTTQILSLPERNHIFPSSRQVNFNGSIGSATRANSITRADTPINSQTYELNADRLWDLHPGDYDVTLVLDSREVRSKNDREYFQEQMSKRGIPTLTRALSVGDALWVAKPKVGGCLSEEIVLDYIIERKKMDDLVHSIKDGRFKEQKFRLKSCGAPKVIYLVEELNMKEVGKFAITNQAIWTSLVRTIAEEGFILKLTTSVEDTLDYLTRFTQKLSIKFKDRSVVGLNDETLTRFQYASLLASNRLPRGIHLSFTTFQHLNAKSGHLTINEVFLRMLMTCRGVSVAKALQIIQKFNTPASLFEAYRQADVDFRKNLLSNQHVIPGRRVSIGLSKRIYDIWNPTM